ncbi:MAG: HD domain-containing protein [Calditrichaceae bacterium]|nr:HD domain-containing protein [Calditrichaceae bacterium]MBN2709492.1 HD domain-containing protein [Calditrichaceae bacterium]RQV95960.1 MAG: HD domain-containing protein [Calditrichota bacterium]
MSVSIDELFSKIYQTAGNCGYQIYVVGGYVRDKLLGKEVKDIDFVVVGDAMVFADRLKKDLHLKRIIRYPRFGTFMACYYNYKLEFVNAREESYQQDSRKPVTKQADLLADLSRRDFTINTLAMEISPEKYGRIIDVYNGKKDLKKKIIRTPLEPVHTFSDDPLRMLRAIRFATRLNFSIEKSTYDSIFETRDRLKIISQERITDELTKIIMSPKPSRGFIMLDETGLLDIILPEMTAMKGIEQRKQYHHKDVFYHTLEVLDNVAQKSGSLKLRLAALFHDIGKPRTKRFDEEIGWTFHGHEVVGYRMAGAILKRLKFSTEIIKYVQKIVGLHLRPMALVNEEVTDSAVRRLIFQAGNDLDDLILLCRADITSKNINRVKKFIKNYDNVVKKIHNVEERDRIRNFQPPVDGLEIMKLFNLKEGPLIGKIKKYLEEAILNGNVPNDHDACISLLQEQKEQLLM